MWQQRSRVLWLQNGDKNTEFFHTTASQRQRKNRIGGLMDEGGVWHEEKGATEKLILEYFSAIFSSDEPVNFDASMEAVDKRVTPEMNKELLEEFKAVEVWRALQQMHPAKSPGPDGMSLIFYQKYWDIVGPSVSNCVVKVLNSGVMPKGINDTYICLIPKTKNPQKITEYSPISLCNVIYKLISKVVANRLKKILNAVINEAQSAFVLGRLITDNVMVAFETMHSIAKKRKGKEGLMAIKLDISKAYDRVEWAYLESIMRKLGFNEKWISLIMMCVTTVSYSVLINGEPRGNITPSRGLRQGDPISPYLFVLCAEGLSAMIRQKEAVGLIKGVVVSRQAPLTSYLFFADDSIFFCRATMEECKQVALVLDTYEKESGQKLNKDKTSLFFSKNTSGEIQNFVKETFGAQIVQQHERYLGLPPMVGRGKKKAFNRIKDQVGRKIASWKGRLLSNAGREILIKAVAQATPTYTMNCFKLPDSLCSEINSMVGGFWWGRKEKERKITWEGARWCVGDGRSIKIWDDRWLPLTKSGRVVSPRPSPEANEKVEGLIVRDRAEWNVEKVRSFFLPHEAEAVLSIPISPMNPRDSQVWAKTANGLFSVKSAYKVAVKYLSDTNDSDASPDCSDNSKMAAIWKMIWSLKDRCDLCEESESSGHILWGCHIAREAWNEKSLKLDCPSRSPREFIEVVWWLMETPGEKNWEEFAIMAWLLWNNRNYVRHGGSCKSGKSIAWEASKYETEVRDSLPIQGKAAPTTSRTKHWVPPLPGKYKVNIDAAVFKEQGCCGVGVVIRNDKGQLMGAMSKRVEFPWGALEAEAKAAKMGVCLAWDLGLKDIEVEGDSLLVAQALKGSTPPALPILKIVEGVKRYLRKFSSWTVVHTRRINNVAAHLLAKSARNVSDCVIWVEDTPPFIEMQILKDVISMDIGPN
ncbi:hypothetical protein SO802_003509 [Lithocarpus litseifolius]|uniref:Reverse transcriptase domain-containing protein n=1 Tax=Lithocarpus litseifolius TaxID=425828 RepID=A0AAW2E0A7_9ROSI